MTQEFSEIHAGVDTFNGCLLMGWAWRPQQPMTRITLQLWIDNVKVATTTANRARTELEKIGMGDGDYGFAFYIPQQFRDGMPHQLQLREEISDTVLESGKLEFLADSGQFTSNGQRLPLTTHLQQFATNSHASDNTTNERSNSKKIGVFTIASKNYLAYVRVLLKSIAKVHPEYKLYLLLADRIDNQFDPATESFTVIEAADIGIENFQDMVLRYDIMEFNTAIKPSMFTWLFNNTDLDFAYYIDPDICIFSRMDKLEKLLIDGASIVLTPHISEPIKDNKSPNDRHMLQAGVFNLGFIAARRSQEALNYMAWWAKKLATTCIVDLKNNYFVDQRWCDLAPCFLNDLKILKDPGYNAAYWNIMHRRIERMPAGGWCVNGVPLVFYHFSGVSIANKEQISKHQDRFSWKDIEAFQKLFSDYLDSLIEQGAQTTQKWPYAYDILGDFPVHRLVRLLYRKLNQEPLDLKGVDLARYLTDMCNARHESGEFGEGQWITRLMALIYELRQDLQNVFLLDNHKGRAEFADWFATASQREYKLPIAISGQANRSNIAKLNEAAPLPALMENQVITNLMYMIWRSRSDLRQHFSLSTAAGQSGFLEWCNDSLQREYGFRCEQPILEETNSPITSNHEVHHAKVGANLIGYAHAEIGMGEHVRMTAAALATTDTAYGVVNFNTNVSARQNAILEHGKLSTKNEYKANIFHINADQMLVAYRNLGKDFFVNRYNIGYWAWELEKCPEEWIPIIDLVDEIWAPSRFIQQAFAEKTGKPVQYMPLCVTLPQLVGYKRSDFDLDSNRYLFLFTFDFASYIERKNPMAIIKAFTLAFPDYSKPVGLVIKVMNARESDTNWKTMLDLIGSDPRIVIINQIMDRNEVLGLLDACDCFVSLHRSEGFGRGPAEALYLGKSVIATNYSGNTDFTLANNSCLVNYELIPVKPEQYVMAHGQRWAEPDVEHAAWYMRKLYTDANYGKELAQEGKKFMRSNFSPAVTGKIYRDRLCAIGMI